MCAHKETDEAILRFQALNYANTWLHRHSDGYIPRWSVQELSDFYTRGITLPERPTPTPSEPFAHTIMLYLAEPNDIRANPHIPTDLECMHAFIKDTGLTYRSHGVGMGLMISFEDEGAVQQFQMFKVKYRLAF